MTERFDPFGVIQAVLNEGREFELRARDLALLVLIQHQIESRSDLAFSIAESEIRALASRVDDLDVRDPAGAERRLTESLGRLLRADCLARADMSRLKLAADAEYQITTLGDSIASWQVEHSRFSGEPLVAILRAFNSQLTAIADKADALTDPEEWRNEVLLQMQEVLKDMLVNVQRHQRALDRQHDELRNFIPTLLTENSEESIARCEAELARVIRTIDDLQQVTLSSTSTAFSLLDKIWVLGVAKEVAGLERVHQDISRRLQSVVHWTTQRASDWVEHHGVVHDFLRTIVRIDRQRRLTDALKRAIALEPDWTLALPDEPRLLRMREDIRNETQRREPPRRSRSDYTRETEEVAVDDLPQRLQQLIAEALDLGEFRWSRVARKILADGAAANAVVFNLPWVLGIAVDAGEVDEQARAWEAVADQLDVEELRVTKNDIRR